MKLNTKFLCKTKYDDYRMCLQAKTLILFTLNPAKLSKHLLFQNFALIKQLYQKPIAVKKSSFSAKCLHNIILDAVKKIVTRAPSSGGADPVVSKPRVDNCKQVP